MKAIAGERKRPAPAGPRPARADAPLPPVLRLQRTVGNAVVQRLLAARERDAPVLAPAVERGIGAARGGGARLDGGARERMEAAFGADFGAVRVHTGAEAGTLSRSLGARAFTTGRDVFFAQGEYRPGTESGDRLIAHELAHVVQQGGRPGAGPLTVGPPGDGHEREAEAAAHAVTSGARAGVEGSASAGAVQRDLTAYWRDHTNVLPAYGGTSVPSVTYRAAAGDLRTALAGLVAAGKVEERDDGTRLFFSESGATRTELEAAFNAAGIPRAAELARALLNHTQTFLFTREKSHELTVLFWTMNMGRTADVVERQTSRPLTAFERAQAALVFAGGLDLGRIRVAEDPLMTLGGYARTTPGTIHFPMGFMGSTDYLPYLIHELTHSWQYQHGVGVGTTAWHAVVSTYDFGGEAGLRAATAAGRHLRDFNTEQQGDIIEYYYRALTAGNSTAAYDPFVAEVRVP